MKVKLYVCWKQEEIFTEEKLEKIITKRQLERREDKDCIAEDIDDYLDQYNRYDIFSLTEEEKKEIVKQVQKDSDKWVRNNVLAEYDEIYIEV